MAHQHSGWSFRQLHLQDQFFRYLAFRVDDPNYDWATFDFDTDPQRLRFMAGILNATNTDLSGFRNAAESC